MDEEILEEIGLSKNEVKVYLSLIRIGLASMSDISRKSGVYRTNVYDAISRLKERGLVCTVEKEGKGFHQASNPEKLMTLLKEKETKLLSILPSLKINHEIGKKENHAVIYEGIASNRMLLEGFLKHDDIITSYGLPDGNVEVSGNWWIDGFHKKRIAKKQEMLHIYNSNAQERINYLNSLPYTNAKYLPKEYNSPVSVEICEDEVLITDWQDPLISIHIKNMSVAKTFRNYFNLLYKLAK